MPLQLLTFTQHHMACPYTNTQQDTGMPLQLLTYTQQDTTHGMPLQLLTYTQQTPNKTLHMACPYNY